MTEPSPADGCLFCRIVAGEVPSTKVAETDLTYAFRDISPAMPNHVLVVPKRHITNAAQIEAGHGGDVADMFVAARQIALDEGLGERGYRLVLNVGPDALNSVPHLHMHLLGGRAMTWPPG